MADGAVFPVGYYDLHPDVTLNFQLNRFWNWVGEPQMLADLRRVAPGLTTYDEWIRQLLDLGERALEQGRMLAGAYLIRAAEFFMPAGDPRRRGARQTFLDTVLTQFGVAPDQHHAVAYEGTTLSAYRLSPASPRGVIVVFGGFDSYIEEWLPMLLALRHAGLDVVAFDGPGQGAALDAGLPMTAEWHRPVGAVLDHFGVDDVTLMGFSLGGCLVMRAAAWEPRVKRVIADDVLTDFTACFAYRLAAPQKALVVNAGRLPAAVVDRLINRARRRNLLADWGIGNAEAVFGVHTPAEALAAVRTMRTDDVSSRVTQDVLLMAGAEDHYVPLAQLGARIKTLTNARSVTARVFTRAESAQNHCQIGNLGLSLGVILDWLDDHVGSPG
ncbi:alpha/beta fold hydrolase [Mycobacterium interjectum]|uniref:alpha/beta fold hydrolase n=1 Tax=Mycobacterium interjectum TaxID=33895 RepID=UPI0008307569|nr:alpha/beta fold hydrolase [Mycobacterium interjectum]MCV7093042.1 alpha/beta fold hydrolase [Mycobacterium interjectum]